MSPCISVSRWLTVVACCVPLLAFAACGGSSGDSSGTQGPAGTTGSAPADFKHVAADPSVAALVPAAVRAKGSLTIATNPTYAPMEFIDADGTTIVGVDIDLADALAGVMGLEAKVVSGSFDGLIPGLAAGKYDVGMAAFGDTKEREKTVDFVTYLSAGSGFYTRASGGVEISSLADLCGHSVAVQQGAVQQEDLTRQSSECKQAGEPPVTILALPDQNAANIAISAGRAELAVGDELVAAYAVLKSHGGFTRTGAAYGRTPYGIALPKGGGLAKLFLAALKALVRDGTYAQILRKWNVTPAAISDPKINGAVY